MQHRDCWSFEPVSMNNRPAPGTYPCGDCSKICSSWHGLKIHQMRMHMYRVPIRAYVDTVHCPVCMVNFGTRIRVLHHLRRAANLCRPIIISRFSRLPVEQVALMDAHDAKNIAAGKRLGHVRGVWTGRACRALGPLMRCCYDEDVLDLPITRSPELALTPG